MITKKQKALIIEKKVGICEIANCYETKNLEVHHLIRKNLGGTDTESNLIVLCKKHHKMIHSNELGCNK